MRKVTVDCQVCRERIALEHAKEVLFETGKNSYHVVDLCPRCLDVQLQAAESINDTSGYRQKAAALIRLADGKVP